MALPFALSSHSHRRIGDWPTGAWVAGRLTCRHHPIYTLPHRSPLGRQLSGRPARIFPPAPTFPLTRTSRGSRFPSDSRTPGRWWPMSRGGSMKCKHCGGPTDWGLCDSCLDREKARILYAPPDTRRCRFCGAWKNAPGHSEFICERQSER